VEELPLEVRSAMPAEAQEVYLRAFNREYAASGDPERAAAAAERRLVPSYEREGTRWVKKETA
jgi:cation transport regulator ChaB